MDEDDFETYYDESPDAKRYSIPGVPKQSTPDDCWVPRGVHVKISRYAIDGGLFYYGENLPAVAGTGLEPSLVDDTLKIGDEDDFNVRQLGYWPSFADAEPDARAAFLNWLANGRRDPTADIGYVYLFLYGLERRALIDAKSAESADTDLAAIQNELRALATTYTANLSFGRRVADLLDFIESDGLEGGSYPEIPPRLAVNSGKRFSHSLALSMANAYGEPYSAQWMLSWYYADPIFEKKKVATAHRPLFEALFLLRWSSAFPTHLSSMRSGATVPTLRKTYRALSPGIGQVTREIENGTLRDVTLPGVGLDQALTAFCEQLQFELQDFSLFVGSRMERVKTAEATFRLPYEFWPEPARAAVQNLDSTWSSDGGTLVGPLSLQELIPDFQPNGLLEKFPPKLFVERLKVSFGICAEPDDRFSYPPVAGGQLVFFKPVDPNHENNEAYERSATDVRFYASLCRADSRTHDIFSKQVFYLIDEVTDLSTSHRLRLKATFLAVSNGRLSKKSLLDRVISTLGDYQPEWLADALIRLCLQAGRASPAHVRVLEKLLSVLGQTPAEVQAKVDKVKPTSVVNSKERLYAQAVEVGVAAVPAFELDKRRIAELRAETQHVGNLLGAIFRDEVSSSSSRSGEQRASVAPVQKQEAVQPAASNNALGLSGPYYLLFRELAKNAQWSRKDLEARCSTLGLFADGALERINEAFLDLEGEVLVDGSEPLEVNLLLASKYCG